MGIKVPDESLKKVVMMLFISDVIIFKSRNFLTLIKNNLYIIQDDLVDQFILPISEITIVTL